MMHVALYSSPGRVPTHMYDVICVHMFGCAYVYMYIYMYMYIYIYIYISACVPMFGYAYVHMYVYIYLYICNYLFVYKFNLLSSTCPSHYSYVLSLIVFVCLCPIPYPPCIYPIRM